VNQKGPKLVTEPEGAVPGPAHGFDIQISSGKEALLLDSGVYYNGISRRIVPAIGNDLKSQVTIGVTQHKGLDDSDLSASSTLSSKVGVDAEDPQEVIRRVSPIAKPVVRHDQIPIRYSN
jgi:hypothetical protein